MQYQSAFDFIFTWSWVISGTLGLLLFRRNEIPGARLIGLAFLCGAAGGALYAAMRLMNPDGWFRSIDSFPGNLRPWLSLAEVLLTPLGVLALTGFGRGGNSLLTVGTQELPAGDAGASLLIPRNQTTSLASAEKLRDDTLAMFERALQSGRYPARVITFKSALGVEEPWWRIEHEITHPNGILHRRATITWVSKRYDFCRFETLGDLTVKDSRGGSSWHGITRIREDEVARVWEHLHGKRRKLKLRPLLVRAAPWQFWRESNRLLPLRRYSVAGWILGICFVVGLLFPPLLIVAVVGLVVQGFVIHRRHPHRFILSAGKPEQDPRILRLLATWHSNLYGLGSSSGEVFQELQHQLAEASPPDIKIAPETIWYYDPDGKVERTQLVISFRRVVAFAQVDGYGNDLHVGWDAHINLGTWSEATVASGRHVDTGDPVELRTFKVSAHIANEYDLADAAFLVEWVHSKVTKLVKQKVKEHQIDEEIDFKIVRDVPNMNNEPGERPKAAKVKRVG